MSKLISRCAKAEIIEQFQQILHALVISVWYCEPYHEHQIENCYATSKASINLVMYLSDAPANTCLLAMLYVCLQINHLASLYWGQNPQNRF
jgi:hypothetical protein